MTHALIIFHIYKYTNVTPIAQIKKMAAVAATHPTLIAVIPNLFTFPTVKLRVVYFTSQISIKMQPKLL